MYGDDGQVIHFNAPKGQLPSFPFQISNEIAQTLELSQFTPPSLATSLLFTVQVNNE